MNQFFDSKFYEDAMASVFSCHPLQMGSDIPKMSQKKKCAARSCASNTPTENQSKVCCHGLTQHVDLAAERPVNAALLHCAAQYSYFPKPLHGWTSNEQLSLIAAIKAVPSERSLMNKYCGWTEEMVHSKYLLLISERVPSKSIEECARCLKHLEVKRVAYFGPHYSQDHRG
jgi:hypothetical protein